MEDPRVVVRGEAIAHAVRVEDDQVTRLELQRLGSGGSHVLAEHAVEGDESCFGFAEAPQDCVSGSGVDGTSNFDVTFGYGGDYSAAAHGLEPATKTAGTVDDDPTNDINGAINSCDFSDFPNSLFGCTGLTFHDVVVPAGTALTRFSLFDGYTDGNDDLDLYVWNSGWSQVGGSGSGTSAEQVDLVLPADTLYHVGVHGWQTDGPDSNYTLFDWSVSATPGGNLSVDSAPASATLGETGTVDISWSGAADGTKHLGAISHSDGGGPIDLTAVSVDTD